MKKIFVVILNFNGTNDLKSCLPTLKYLYSDKYHLETVILDNGSSTNELNKLSQLLKKYPKIKLLKNGKNIGFAKGNNIGIKYALDKNADYIVLLNNDTKIESNFIKRGVDFKADIISPVVKFREFKDKPQFLYDLGGYVNWWTGRTSHINAYRDEYLKKVKEPPLNVDYVAGCSMMIKRDVFEKIGLLDETYFIYFEDVDFCVSAKKAGFSVLVDPASTIFHKLGGSMDRWSARAIYYNLLSNFIFISKHFGIRRITAYTYLFTLTLKILRDNIISYFRGNNFNSKKKMWRGAKHESHE